MDKYWRASQLWEVRHDILIQRPSHLQTSQVCSRMSKYLHMRACVRCDHYSCVLYLTATVNWLAWPSHCLMLSAYTSCCCLWLMTSLAGAAVGCVWGWRMPVVYTSTYVINARLHYLVSCLFHWRTMVPVNSTWQPHTYAGRGVCSSAMETGFTSSVCHQLLQIVT